MGWNSLLELLTSPSQFHWFSTPTVQLHHHVWPMIVMVIELLGFLQDLERVCLCFLLLYDQDFDFCRVICTRFMSLWTAFSLTFSGEIFLFNHICKQGYTDTIGCQIGFSEYCGEWHPHSSSSHSYVWNHEWDQLKWSSWRIGGEYTAKVASACHVSDAMCVQEMEFVTSLPTLCESLFSSNAGETLPLVSSDWAWPVSTLTFQP